ncbi:MAG: nuclear transport factor 2 family protein [Solirubrobacterales bacterium]
MSQENVEIALRQFEHFNAQEFGPILDAWTEDVTTVVHGALGLTGRSETVGKEAVAQVFADWFGQFGSDYRAEIDEVHDLGDRVLVVATDRTHGRRSGAPVTLQVTYLYTLREHRICRMELWDNRDDALEAAGLSE